MDKVQECVGGAYILLLTLPHTSMSRLRLQGALSALRDELALLRGVEPEVIQNFFESLQAPN